MSQPVTTQYTSHFDVRKGKMTRLLPVGAILIDAYANNYLGVTVNFMATRRLDAERVPLPSAEKSAEGCGIEGFFRYHFVIAPIGADLPPEYNWCVLIKVCDPRYGSAEAYYLFYALEP